MKSHLLHSSARTLTRLAATVVPLLLSTAHAIEATQPEYEQHVAGKTREEVRAELAEAVRTGDIAVGNLGAKLNELFPSRYPPRPVAAAKAREQVKAETAEAIRTGDIIAGESGTRLHDQFPSRYRMAAGATQATRASE